MKVKQLFSHNYIAVFTRISFTVTLQSVFSWFWELAPWANCRAIKITEPSTETDENWKA